MAGILGAAAAVVVIAAVVAIVILVLLIVAVRVIKAAHARPLETTASLSGQDATHSHDGSHTQSELEGAVLAAVSRLFRLMIRLGVRVGPMMMLTVRGRKSGVPRVNPVDLFERDGRNWLVATHDANASWVRNLRAASEGALALGRRRWKFTAVELPQDQAGAVLKEVLGPRLARPVAGFVLRQTLAVPPDAPLEEFVAAAALHPVFEVALSPDSSGAVGANPGLAKQAEENRLNSRSVMISRIAIVVGLLIVAAHATAGVTGVLGAGQWISGIVIGLVVAGVGNHVRIFGRR